MHIRVHDCNGGQYTLPARDVMILPSLKDAKGCVVCREKLVVTRETRAQLEAMLAATTKVIGVEELGEPEDLHPNVTCLDPVTPERKLLNYGPLIVNAVAHKRRLDMLLPPCGPILVERDGKVVVRSDLMPETVEELSNILDNLLGHEIHRAVETFETYQQLMAEGHDI